MDRTALEQIGPHAWRIPKSGAMRVPAVIYADAALIDAMDDKVAEQITNVACLPGIVVAAYAMPDAHWGYGFPIGGVAAFDPDEGGVVSAGGVGFDISCGVRLLTTNLTRDDIAARQEPLAHELSRSIPAGVGSHGRIELDEAGMAAMLAGGAAWAAAEGYGRAEDLERIEERGTMAGARPDLVSERALLRQRREMGTLGSGNHYLEVQHVAEIFDPDAARACGLEEGQAVVMIHCGSRGLGHQIGTEYPEAHAAPLQGRIAELHPDRDFGQIALTDGRLVYFHRHSVVEGRFEDLAQGDTVELAVADGDSPHGPHASSVRPISSARFVDAPR